MGVSLFSLMTTLFFALPSSPAQAHSSGPDFSQVTCWTWASVPWSYDFGRGCFEWYGDEWWVEDTEADGYSTKLHWETAGGLFGACRNYHGASTWHKCDGTDYIDEQDDVRWYMCLTDGPSEVEIACTYDYFDQWRTCWKRADNGHETSNCNTPRQTADSVSGAASGLAVTVRSVEAEEQALTAADTADCTYWLAGTGTTGNWGDSCFAPYGDISFVNDYEYNGWRPVVLVEASYKENSGDDGNKTRLCVHDTYDERSAWVSCNYDHRETHCVRWWIYEQKIDTGITRNYTGPTPWLGVDDGRPGNCLIE